MAKTRRKSIFSSALFWGVISAAFIGPGTVTTASKAGAGYGLSLLWALVFSTLATLILQETVARIQIASNQSFGDLIRLKFPRLHELIRWTLFLAVGIGCAAYEAGNLLGAIAGLNLIFPGFQIQAVLAIGLISFLLLWTGTTSGLARLLGVIVALMGLAYLLVAFKTPMEGGELLKGAFLPGWNRPSAAWIAIALIGTTIVPYNLFLGSGLSKGQDIREMRWGLLVAIVFGGVISMAVLVVGTRVTGPFSFESMSLALSSGLGDWARDFFAFGLFAAGITSAVTAPLAAAVTAKILLQRSSDNWHSKHKWFRITWIVILGAGVFFAVGGIKPIPAIITAQALNGLLLPFVAIFIWMIAWDRRIMGEYVNSKGQQLMLSVVVAIALFLGGYNIWMAVSKLI